MEGPLAAAEVARQPGQRIEEGSSAGAEALGEGRGEGLADAAEAGRAAVKALAFDEALGPGGGNVADVAQEDVEGAGAELGEPAAEGLVVALERRPVGRVGGVEPAQVAEEPVAGRAAPRGLVSRGDWRRMRCKS